MRRAFVVACVLVVASAARAEDVAPEDRAFVEIVASKNGCFVGETIRLRLRVGFDAEFFRDHGVQMFAQKLDVPVRVEAPWLKRPVGATLLDTLTWSIAQKMSFALDDGIASDERVENVARNGRTYEVLEVEKLCTPAVAGDLTIPGPTLRFAYAGRFEDDFVHGRVPVDRRDALVRGAPLVIHVRALPEAGRPPEFAGAIGRFTVISAANKREVDVGETFKVTVAVDGDTDSFAAPRLGDVAGFHVYGMLSPAPGKFVYDVAAVDEHVTSIPPIAFASFDPDAGQYRVVKTDAIPLHVRPSTTPSRPTTDVAEHEQSPMRWIVLETAAAGLAIVCIVLVRRARARREQDEETPHVREAAAAFRTRMDAQAGDVADALAAFLAACLRCPPAAVVSPDLSARLVAAGAPSDVATRAASLLERLVASRYGGDASADDAASARAVVDELETALSTAAR